jgi:hypothetical protein
MPSPSESFPISHPVLELWRAEGGQRLTYSEIAWVGAATAMVGHASLHFFSAAIYGLERFLVLFAPPERLALGLTEGGDPLATWLVLLAAVGVWGAMGGVTLLAVVHGATDLARRWLRR